MQLAPAAIRSITVSPSSGLTFGNCDGADPTKLAFPNGHCFVGLSSGTPPAIVGGITITNGAVAGTILVNGQNATPADAGTPWTLGGSNPPGPDQFFENTFNTSAALHLSTVPQCDTTFNEGSPSCAAAAGQSVQEGLGLIGPSSSTDTNGPFTITTTWTAAP